MNNLGLKSLFEIPKSEWNNFIELFIDGSRNIRKKIINSKIPETSMISILRDTYAFNLLLSYVGMMMLLEKDEMWNRIDRILDNYTTEFYNDEMFATKIKSLIKFYEIQPNQTKQTAEYLCFLRKLSTKFNLTPAAIKLDEQIGVFENRIHNMMFTYPTIKISKKYLNNANNDSIMYDGVDGNMLMITLTPNNYCKLVETIDDIQVRHKIENKYLSITQPILEDLEKLIIKRHDLAKLNGFDTYFKYINKDKYDNTTTIKDLIVALESKIEKKCHDELNVVYNFINRRNAEPTKISQSDMIKYISAHKSNITFDISLVIDAIFGIFKKYFQMSFAKASKQHNINNRLTVYTAIDELTGKSVGKLYTDIMYDANKNINVPLAIKLVDRMQITENKCSDAEIALIANCGDQIYYSDVVLLFKEFGYVLQHLSYSSCVGLVNYDEEFANLLPLLFEYIARDNEIIFSMLKNKNQMTLDHFDMTRHIDICFSLKLRCVNAKFDHLIHNSPQLIEILQKAQNSRHALLDLYTEIYNDTFKMCSGIFDTNIQHIDPSTIIQEINNSQGVLYSNLMNEIFAYMVYWLIIKEGNDDFKSAVLKDSVLNYRELLRKFIKRSNENCFQLFVKDVIRINVENCDNATEDTNYFDDRETDTESDKEQIIRITRYADTEEQKLKNKQKSATVFSRQ